MAGDAEKKVMKSGIPGAEPWYTLKAGVVYVIHHDPLCALEKVWRSIPHHFHGSGSANTLKDGGYGSLARLSILHEKPHLDCQEVAGVVVDLRNGKYRSQIRAQQPNGIINTTAERCF